MPRTVPYRRPSAVPVYVGLLFAESLASMLTFTVTNLYFVTELGMSPFALVLCGTAMELAIFVFEVPTGIVADLVSRRASVVLSYLVIGVAVIGFGLLPSVPLVIAAYALWGIGYTFQSGALDAWLADEIGTEPAHARRAPGSAGGLGWAPLLGVGLAIVVGGASLRVAIVAGGVAMLAIGVALAFVMPESAGSALTRRTETGGVRAFAATARRGAREVHGHPVLLLLLGVALHLRGVDGELRPPVGRPVPLDRPARRASRRDHDRAPDRRGVPGRDRDRASSPPGGSARPRRGRWRASSRR